MTGPEAQEETIATVLLVGASQIKGFRLLKAALKKNKIGCVELPGNKDAPEDASKHMKSGEIKGVVMGGMQGHWQEVSRHAGEYGLRSVLLTTSPDLINGGARRQGITETFHTSKIEDHATVREVISAVVDMPLHKLKS